MVYAQDFIEQGSEENFDIRGVDKFESEFTQRTNDADVDEFIHQYDNDQSMSNPLPGETREGSCCPGHDY
jgi:hypothetical protein